MSFNTQLRIIKIFLFVVFKSFLSCLDLIIIQLLGEHNHLSKLVFDGLYYVKKNYSKLEILYVRMVEEVVNVLQSCFFKKFMSCVNSTPNIITHKKKSHMKTCTNKPSVKPTTSYSWYVLEYHNMKDESESQTWGY